MVRVVVRNTVACTLAIVVLSCGSAQTPVRSRCPGKSAVGVIPAPATTKPEQVGSKTELDEGVYWVLARDRLLRTEARFTVAHMPKCIPIEVRKHEFRVPTQGLSFKRRPSEHRISIYRPNYHKVAPETQNTDVIVHGVCSAELRFTNAHARSGVGGATPKVFSDKMTCEAARAPIIESCDWRQQCTLKEESTIPFSLGECQSEVERLSRLVQPFVDAKHRAAHQGLHRFEQVLKSEAKVFVGPAEQVGEKQGCIPVRIRRARTSTEINLSSGAYEFSWQWTDSVQSTKVVVTYDRIRPLFGKAYATEYAEFTRFHSGGPRGAGRHRTSEVVGLAFLSDRFLLDSRVFYFTRSTCMNTEG